MSSKAQNTSTSLILALCFLGAALGVTIAVTTFDLRPIACDGSMVGLAGLNSAIFGAFGSSELMDKVGDIVLLLAILVCVCFGVMGVIQVVKRGFAGIDRTFYCLAIVYVLVAVLYVLFDIVTVNNRPILVDGVAEGSFPSSHTMAVVLVLGTAPMALGRLFDNRGLATIANVAAVVLILVMAVSRVLSGMHWTTDVIAGVLYALALVALFSHLLNTLGAGQAPADHVSPREARRAQISAEAAKYSRENYSRARSQVAPRPAQPQRPQMQGQQAPAPRPQAQRASQPLSRPSQPMPRPQGQQAPQAQRPSQPLNRPAQGQPRPSQPLDPSQAPAQPRRRQVPANKMPANRSGRHSR